LGIPAANPLSGGNPGKQNAGVRQFVTAGAETPFAGYDTDEKHRHSKAAVPLDSGKGWLLIHKISFLMETNTDAICAGNAWNKTIIVFPSGA